MNEPLRFYKFPERRMSLSERKSETCKRNSESEGSNIKRMRLAEDSDVLLSLSRTGTSSVAYSVSDSEGFSAAFSDEDNHRSSSIISSDCSSEIVTDTRQPFSDLEVLQVSETEISTLITNNLRKTAKVVVRGTAEMNSVTTEMRDQQRKPEKREKSPTESELDDFFSAAEKYEQRRFTERYNYDIVNDTPLEGRFQWVTLKP